MTTKTDKNEFHALRWRAVADALGLDPSCDPSISGLRVRFNAAQEARERLVEVNDLLAERMALLDRDKPGVTLIECIRGMLEETTQKPEQVGPHLSSELRLRDRAKAAEAKVKALEAELTLAEAELRGPSARMGEALKALGWHGAGDPREWADAKRLEIERDLAAERDRQHADLVAARNEASHQRQRAVKLEADIGTITAAYFNAGFGPSPTTPAKVAASIGTLQADLAVATKTATVRGHALNALGWDGRSDPESWAKNEVMLREAAGSDIRALRAKTERDAKIRGDALKVLGWNGDEHPEAWAPRLLEGIRRGREMLDKLEGPVPIRSVLIAAVEALGWKLEDGDPEDWAIGKARMIAEHGAQMERANAHAARWRRACGLFCWAPETEPPTMIDFSRAQALLVAPLKAALGPGFIDDSPALIVGLAVKRIERDAATWEDARRRAIDALVEPLKAATGAFAAPSPARLVDIAVMRIQVGDKAMDDLATVRTAAHKLVEGVADLVTAVDPKELTQPVDLSPARWKVLAMQAEQQRKDAARMEQAHRDHGRLDKDLTDVAARYDELAAAVCPFPKDHEKLIAQAIAARDRALVECSAALPPGYRLEHVTPGDPPHTPNGGPYGYRWAKGGARECNLARGGATHSPGLAVGLAWDHASAVGSEHAQIIAAHRWRAADLQALLEHERKLHADSMQRLVDLAKPVMGLIRPAFSDAVSVVQALVTTLQAATFVERDL